MADLRIGGRCERHLCPKPCNHCAKEGAAQATYSPADLRSMLKLTVPKHGSQKALAAALGISEQYLSDILRARREPGEGVLDALGLERVVTYRAKDASGVRAKCPACGGNDADAPCAYPEGGQPGCLKDARGVAVHQTSAPEIPDNSGVQPTGGRAWLNESS